MKMRKVISAFLVLICLFTAFGLCTLGASAAEGARTVYATTSASVQQGSYGYLYVYLDDLTDVSALNVSVHYDTDKITVKNVYNRVSSVVNDLATGDGSVNASYIFDGKGTAAKTNLFYIYYQVNSTAEVGDAYFDIVVGEAFDSALKPMDFAGSRCAFEIAEQTVSKSCTISSTSKVSTSVGEEFELSYRLSTYQIASGSMNIQYDPELFEVVTVVNGGFLEGKIADVNTALDGTVSVSFVGTTYNYQYDVVTVRFKTLKNVIEDTDIKLVVSELYDKELTLYSCQGYTTKANIVFDETYTEDAPSMSISSSYGAETGKVTATIKLEKNSMLGAGDFVLKFDTRYLTFVSAEKGFSPTFFNINDKDAADGILKFSIISLSDITEEQIILTASFDAKHCCQDITADFEISGSGLTDSLVNTIMLNFVDASITIPLKHTEATEVVENRVEPTCTVDGGYDSVVYCAICKAELSRETKSIPAHGHTKVVVPGYEASAGVEGLTDGVSCSVCGAVLVPQEIIPAKPVEEFKIASAYLNLTKDINMMWRTKVPTGYENPYMVFTLNGVSYTATSYTVDEQGRLCFMFPGVMPHQLGDNIRATLYATCDGELVSVVKDNYSIKDYAAYILANYPAGSETATLMSDIMVYGEKLQLYRGYKTDALVTEGLTLSPSEFKTLDAEKNKLSLVGTPDDDAKWKGAGLYLENAMSVRFSFTATDIEGLTVEITINGRKTVYNVSELTKESDGQYKIYFRGISASEFDDEITAIFKRNGEQVGRTVTYSVNSYVHYMQNSASNDKLVALIKAIYSYGASAEGYSN